MDAFAIERCKESSQNCLSVLSSVTSHPGLAKSRGFAIAVIDCNARPNCNTNLVVFVIIQALPGRPYIDGGTDELRGMPSDKSARAKAGNSVQCSRIDLSEASKLPSQDAGSPAWPFRSRKQQLDGLLFSPRELCTSPDEFTDVVCYAKNKHCLV